MTHNQTRRLFLGAGPAVAVFGALGAAAAAETPAISPELERLIASHDVAFYKVSHAAGATCEEYDELSSKDYDAFTALASYQCLTIEEARIWAHHIVDYTKWAQWPERAVEALCALAGLPAEGEA